MRVCFHINLPSTTDFDPCKHKQNPFLCTKLVWGQWGWSSGELNKGGGGGTISVWLVVTPPQQLINKNTPSLARISKIKKSLLKDKFSNCFSVHNISHTKIAFYTYLKKKQKQKQKAKKIETKCLP